MAIVSSHPVFLRELRFVFPVRVKVWRGEARLRSRGVEIVLHEGDSFIVPTFVQFSMFISPHFSERSMKAAFWSLSSEEHLVDAAISSAGDFSKPSAMRLAREIFFNPSDNWNTEHAGALLQTQARQLCRHLFTEAESFRALVSEQRIAAVLMRLANVSQVALDYRSSGYRSHRKMLDALINLGFPDAVLSSTLSVSGASPSRSQQGLGDISPKYRLYF